MLSSAPGKSSSRTDTPQCDRSLIAHKIWLPRLIYSALPWFYVSAGIAALLATVYINKWFWILPHYLLFSIACVHLGLRVLRRRRRGASDKA